MVGALAVSLCVLSLLIGTVSADNGQTADQVADQIIAVQAKADAAAGQWTNLDDDARDIATQVDATQAQVDAAATTYNTMESMLAEIAMNKYTGALPQFIPFTDSLMHDVETDALTGFALGTGAVDLDQFGAAQRDLARKQAQLADVRDRNTKAVDRVQAKRADLDAQITQLSELEGKLRDAEVKKAYEAKLAAKRQREADAAAARDAAASAAVAASAASATVLGARGGGFNATTETPVITAAPTTTATPAATLSPTPSPSSRTSPSPNTSNTSTTGPNQLATTTAPDRTPNSDVPTPTTDPAAPPPTTGPPAADPPPSTGGLVCPVAGTVAFGDTWGDPRPGGRHHEGVDMISPLGTPLVAIDDGVATMKTTSLGGNSVGLRANDGTYFFYAHLSSWEGPSRAVHAGEVIGYVGHTGDTSVNHLHFEIHPGGAAAIDPYPIVRRIC